MIAEARFDFMLNLRSYVSVVVEPLHWATSLPSKLFDQATTTLAQREALLAENEALKSRNLHLSIEAQKFAKIASENESLRSLLRAKRNLKEELVLAEVVGLGYTQSVQEVIINRGRKDGVYLGQPIVDSYGLMASVSSIGPYTSRAILISDSSVSIPVQVNRNGHRFILSGAGKDSNMILKNVPITADIKKDDLLVTSGLAGRFPYGYPVAIIDSIENIKGETFLQVNAKPIAKLNTSRYVLLVSHTITGIKPEDLINIGEK